MTREPMTAHPLSAYALLHHGPVRNLPQLMQAVELQHRQPIVNLREALLQLRILDEPLLQALQAEDPDLLRSRSAELVTRLLLTDDERQRVDSFPKLGHFGTHSR